MYALVWKPKAVKKYIVSRYNPNRRTSDYNNECDWCYFKNIIDKYLNYLFIIANTLIYKYYTVKLIVPSIT